MGSALHMQPIAIEITETAGIPRHAELVTLGVPFAREWNADPAGLTVLDERTNTPVPCQLTPLGNWPDGRLRWLSIAFPVQLRPHEQGRYLLQTGSPVFSPSLSVTRDKALCTIDTGSYTFQLDQQSLEWKKDSHTSTVELIDDQGHKCSSHIEGGWQIVNNGAIYADLEAQGYWQRQDTTRFARFHCRLRFQRDSGTVIANISIHNPQRARHAGGLWDLGDPGSFHFRSLGLVTRLEKSSRSELLPTADGTPIIANPGEALRIFQNSSGGDHWNSRNHIDASGTVTTRFRGYQISCEGAILSSGDRAQPILRSGGIQVSLRHFWQQFPSALSVANQQLSIELFPGKPERLYELQAGERKNQTCYLDYSQKGDLLLWANAPLQPALPAEHYQHANAFPWFKANADLGPLESIIQRGVDGPSNFFNKREVIDEYGWRNFGDLFADHETHNQPAGQPPLISHYNNQYDPVYGFARQFALSGNGRWFELMDDLARHIADIDIYHSTEDRSEYNNGLFWHTDHYLDAHTATHRTYTRHNSTSSVAGQTGGGPAAEHCYTTGLLYHYWMTGNDTSRQAVLELAGWITANQEGVGGALEQILALKKNELPQLKAMLKGQTPSPHRYPFTRGTGNYLNALLDAWQLSLEPRWLKQAESVIAATLHPADDIEQRELLNAELRWSYLVLLAAIVKYLQIKIEAGQIGDAYHYARDALVHYTRWMVANERPFLSMPEQLEFPNHTWVAQDIRKAMLMFQASRIDPEWSDRYLAKGQEWLEYVTITLQDSPEGHYTRILVLLMLNHGPHHAWQQQMAYPALDNPRSYSAPHLTWATLTQRVAKRIIKCVINFRPARERAWLKTRMN